MRQRDFAAASGSYDRRQFVKASAALAAVLPAFAAAESAIAEQTAATTDKPLIAAGDVVLFQGDSITDAGRKRDVNDANSFAALGTGYAWLAASQLLTDRPQDDLKIFNRGVSGNKVYQLDERWQADCVDLKPHVLSILIGVNDIWHTLNGAFDSTPAKYEASYRELLKRTREALPEVHLVICEPFVLRCGSVTDKWFPDFDGYRAAARKLADEAGAAFVPFQAMFDAASKLAPPEHWAADGVHPTPYGAALMAHAWLKATAGG